MKYTKESIDNIFDNNEGMVLDFANAFYCSSLTCKGEDYNRLYQEHKENILDKYKIQQTDFYKFYVRYVNRYIRNKTNNRKV